MNKTSKIVIIILIVICTLLLIRFVVFKKAFDQFGKDLENMGTWEKDYKKEHPDATKAEIDAAFTSSMDGLKKWQDSYKQEHPNATKSEIDTAFKAQWNTN